MSTLEPTINGKKSPQTPASSNSPPNCPPCPKTCDECGKTISKTSDVSFNVISRPTSTTSALAAAPAAAPEQKKGIVDSFLSLFGMGSKPAAGGRRRTGKRHGKRRAGTRKARKAGKAHRKN